MARTQMTCTCKGYPFIHRLGGGKCLDDGGGMFCGACGQSCESTTVDFGYGGYEFWGRTGNHRDIQTVSACCEAAIYSDASLTKLNT